MDVREEMQVDGITKDDTVDRKEWKLSILQFALKIYKREIKQYGIK